MVIFGTGVVTGGLLVRQTILTKNPHAARSPRLQPTSPGGMRMEFLRRVERELDLTPAQQQKIDKILSTSQERTKKIMEPVSPLLREEMQLTRENVRAALTPAQRARFDKLVKAQQRPREAKRGGKNRQSGISTNLPATNPAPAQ